MPETGEGCEDDFHEICDLPYVFVSGFYFLQPGVGAGEEVVGYSEPGLGEWLLFVLGEEVGVGGGEQAGEELETFVEDEVVAGDYLYA